MTIDEMISNLETATMLFSNVVIDRDGVSQLKSWLTELKELRTLNQPQIDELVHGQEVEVPKLTDEEVNELLSTVNPNEVTTDCDDCKARIRADIIEELKQKISSCAYNKNIQMISMELLWNCLEQLKEKKQ